MKCLRKIKIKKIILLSFPIYLVVSLTFCKKKEEPRVYNIGIVTWAGNGPFFLAKEKGFYEKAGLKINLRVLDGPGERESAFLAGEIDFFPNTPDAFSIFSTKEVNGKIFMVTDESNGADGIVAKENIHTIIDLKGKNIGCQQAITSHFLLLYELNKHGLSQNEIKFEKMGAGEAGAAFVAGQLDAAVTWEPWLTKVRESKVGHSLITTKEEPGLIFDIVLARQDILDSKPEDVKKFIKIWYEALYYWKRNPRESIEIMARGLKLSTEEYKEAIATIKFPNYEESLRYFGTLENPGPVYNVFNMASKLYQQAGIINKIPNANDFIDPTFLLKLYK